MEDGQYEDGKKHGDWTTYYANGNKRSEGAYDRGRKEGRWVQYWPNGNVKSEAEFRDDKYTGFYSCYYANGNRQWEGRYNDYTGTSSADGTKEGAWLVYSEEDGETVIRRMTYHRGSRAKPDETPPFKDE